MQQQQGHEESDRRTSFNVVYLVASGWAWCILPFLRWNIGPSAIGMRGLVAIGVMWAYMAFARCPEIMSFFVVWLVFVILQRLRTARLVSLGAVMHSQYPGDPLVMKMFPRIRKVGNAKALEAMLCIFGGLLLAHASQKLGGFVAIGGVAMAILAVIDMQAINIRKQAMRDAELEQRFMADLHRGRRDDY
jgi:hypothetical protein